MRSVFFSLPNTIAELPPKSLRNDLRAHALLSVDGHLSLFVLAGECGVFGGEVRGACGLGFEMPRRLVNKCDWIIHLALFSQFVTCSGRIVHHSPSGTA